MAFNPFCSSKPAFRLPWDQVGVLDLEARNKPVRIRKN